MLQLNESVCLYMIQAQQYLKYKLLYHIHKYSKVLYYLWGHKSIVVTP